MSSSAGLRFSANLSFLFQEVPFLERFEMARRAGFRGVEFMWPQGEDLQAVRNAAEQAGVRVALFNFDAGDMAAGERGLCAHPHSREAFRRNVPVALELAEQLRCTRLNALIGLRDEDLDLDDQIELARENVTWAARQAREVGASVMIEAINSIENGPYLLDGTAKALRFIDELEAENVLLQYDAYHMQRMEGDLTHTLIGNLARVGHVQIADSPDRHEPGTGEIEYRYLLERLRLAGYEGWVGLEYRPSTADTNASFGWMTRFGYSPQRDAQDTADA